MKISIVVPMVFLAAALLAPTSLDGVSAPQPSATHGIGPGLVVHIDPATGQLLPLPDTGSLPALAIPPESALSTSAEGLEEMPSPVPGGGVMVRLEGRFQNHITATTDGNGALSTVCATPADDVNSGPDSQGTTLLDGGNNDGGEQK